MAKPAIILIGGPKRSTVREFAINKEVMTGPNPD
jgi:hypothetical protein